MKKVFLIFFLLSGVSMAVQAVTVTELIEQNKKYRLDSNDDTGIASGIDKETIDFIRFFYNGLTGLGKNKVDIDVNRSSLVFKSLGNSAKYFPILMVDEKTIKIERQSTANARTVKVFSALFKALFDLNASGKCKDVSYRQYVMPPFQRSLEFEFDCGHRILRLFSHLYAPDNSEGLVGFYGLVIHPHQEDISGDRVQTRGVDTTMRK